MISPFLTSLICLWIFPAASSFDEPKTVEAKTGEDCDLHCHNPTQSNVQVLQWKRPDLESDGYVFLHQKKLLASYQHPSFRGRVQLRDPEMKNGDVSVILKNVNIDDTGTYECRIIISNTEGREGDPTEIKHIIQLTVTDSGDTAGNTWTEGDKAEAQMAGGDKDGNMEGRVGLIVGLSVPAVIVVGFVIFIIYKRPLKKVAYVPPAETAGDQQEVLKKDCV